MCDKEDEEVGDAHLQQQLPLTPVEEKLNLNDWLDNRNIDRALREMFEDGSHE